MLAMNAPKQVSISSSSICLTMMSSPREDPGDSNNDEGELGFHARVLIKEEPAQDVDGRA
jgi:hypothetical protein